jgi:potassium intermediate/small conductance calcium-activated channel subfamily N protein 2
MIIVSLIVVTVTNMLQMTNVEGKAFTVIKKLDVKNNLKENAALVITKAARLHLKLKRGSLIFKHDIIGLGEAIETFQKIRRKYQNVKDMGQNQIDEILREFTSVQKTNDEMIVYMSALANMVQKLKTEKDDLEKDLHPTLTDSATQEVVQNRQTLKKIE